MTPARHLILPGTWHRLTISEKMQAISLGLLVVMLAMLAVR